MTRPQSHFTRIALILSLLCDAVFCARAQAPDDAATTRALRVVSLSPNITETIFALGAGECIVGRSSFCEYPPEALAIRNCGGAYDPNFEVLAAVEPDLILVLGQQQNVVDFAAARGIRVEHFKLDSIETLRQDIARVGVLVGRDQAARDFLKDFNTRIEQERAAAAKAQSGVKPRVFITLGHSTGNLSSVHTIAGGSYLDEAIALAGGENIFADVTNPYPQVSQESLLARRPEMIIELMPALDAGRDAAKIAALRRDWRALDSLPAVHEGRIQILTDDFLLIPGPRFPEIVAALRKALAAPPVPTAEDAAAPTANGAKVLNYE